MIGNPPYGANIDALVKVYEKRYPNTSHGFKDIYKYFFDRGLELCHKDAILCYITPNTYLRQPRYGDVRRVILGNQIEQILDLGENIFQEAVVPVAITLITRIDNTSNHVKFIDLTSTINVDNAGMLLSKIDFHVISQESWQFTQNNIFIENIRERKDNEIPLEEVLDMKDCGFKYQRSNVGLSQKGKNDLAERIFYTGPLQNENDIPILIGKDINEFYHVPKPQKVLRHNYEDLLRSNESTYYNRAIMGEPVKLIWRQTAPYFIGTVLKESMFFGNTIQAGVIKQEYRNSFSYEYLCGLLNSSLLRKYYEMNVKESGRVFPQVKLEKLRPLPIIIPTAEQKKKIEDLVESIIQLRMQDKDITLLQKELDANVLALYESEGQ